MNSRLLLKIAGAAVLAAFLTGDAKADTKVVSTVNVTGQMRFGPQPDPNAPPDFPQTVTVYYKGADARVESSNGEVKIFKGAEGKVYSMLPSKKIYFVRTYSEEVAPTFGGRGGGNFKPDVTVTVKTDSAVVAKTLAGVSATRNAVTGTLTLPNFGGGGGRGGRGGQPGGGTNAVPPAASAAQQGAAPKARFALEGVPGDVQDSADDTTPATAPPTGTPDFPATPPTPPANAAPRVMQLTGEVWTSPGVALPDDPKATVLPSLVTLGRAFNLFVTPLIDSINKGKLIPLDVKLSYTRPGRPNDTTTPTPTVATITTKSVSTATVDAALFAAPGADYTKVDPPAPPQWGGRGGRGGRGGNGGGPGGNNAPGGGAAPAPPAD